MAINSPTPPPPSSNGSAGRVLVIDDSESMLEAISGGLSAAGFSVIATSQTVGAARHLKTCDLVIVDFHMPGLDGATVLESLKSASDRSGAHCMFLLYTSDPAEARRYRTHGFDGPLTNKGDIRALVRQVQAYMRMVRARGAAGAK
jgi:DNA-binding response OmpR family regulator